MQPHPSLPPPGEKGPPTDSAPKCRLTDAGAAPTANAVRPPQGPKGSKGRKDTPEKRTGRAARSRRRRRAVPDGRRPRARRAPGGFRAVKDRPDGMGAISAHPDVKPGRRPGMRPGRVRSRGSKGRFRGREGREDTGREDTVSGWRERGPGGSGGGLSSGEGKACVPASRFHSIFLFLIPKNTRQRPTMIQPKWPDLLHISNCALKL